MAIGRNATRYAAQKGGEGHFGKPTAGRPMAKIRSIAHFARFPRTCLRPSHILIDRNRGRPEARGRAIEAAELRHVAAQYARVLFGARGDILGRARGMRIPIRRRPGLVSEDGVGAPYRNASASCR